jgi:hypothetical protein
LVNANSNLDVLDSVAKLVHAAQNVTLALQCKGTQRSQDTAAILPAMTQIYITVINSVPCVAH